MGRHSGGLSAPIRPSLDTAGSLCSMLRHTSGVCCESAPLVLRDAKSSSFVEYAEAALSDGCTEMTTSLDRYAIRATKIGQSRTPEPNPQSNPNHGFCKKYQHIPASSGVFKETPAAAIEWYPGSNVKAQARRGYVEWRGRGNEKESGGIVQMRNGVL